MKRLILLGFLGLFFALKLSANEAILEANTKTAREFLNALYTDKAKVESLLGSTYTQHNQHYEDGKEAIIKALPYFKGELYIARTLAEDDLVVLHNEFSEGENKGVGFDIFRIKKGKITEHWDNLAPKMPLNPSKRSQIDGEFRLDKSVDTKASKKLVKAFVKDILMGRNLAKLEGYFDGDDYIQHNAFVKDGVQGFARYLNSPLRKTRYLKIHKLIAQNDFVLVIAELEDKKSKQRLASYDLFRVQAGKIAEHWDIIEPILSPSEAKNKNSKFGF